jgi:hypothetical protein
MFEILAAVFVAASTTLPPPSPTPAVANPRQLGRVDGIRVNGIIYFDAPTRTPQTICR